jgi:hypothetical protein
VPPVHNARAEEIAAFAAIPAWHAFERNAVIDVFPFFAIALPLPVDEANAMAFAAKPDGRDHVSVAGPLPAAHCAAVERTGLAQPVHVERAAMLNPTVPPMPPRSETIHSCLLMDQTRCGVTVMDVNRI